MVIYRNLIILFLFLGLYFACGRNPTEPPVKPDVRTIRGNARLENQTDHYGIFVYLEELKLYTFTDMSGDYQLNIPDSLMSNQHLIIQGQFHIYYAFYLYEFDSVVITTNNEGFVYNNNDLNGQGQIKPIILTQYLDFKTTTDKKVYTPEEKFWVQLTMTNLSNTQLAVCFPMGIDFWMSDITLFNDSVCWYLFTSTTFSEARYALNPGDSLNVSCRFPLISIREPKWNITLPWQCWVMPEGFYISPPKLPGALKWIVADTGHPGRYIPESIQKVGFYKFLINKFRLAKITITQ